MSRNLLAFGARAAFLPTLMLVGSSMLSAQPTTQKMRVAVMDMSGTALRMQQASSGLPGGIPGMQTTTTVSIPAPADFARGLTEMLNSVVAATGRFSVLERTAMQQMDTEQALAASGRTTKETGARAGALLGAQALLTGDITGFVYSKSSVGGKMTNVLKGVTANTERITAQVNIDLRLIDPSTGELLYSAKGEGKASQMGVSADLLKGDRNWSAGGSAATPLGEASREALEKAVKALLNGMPQIAWTGRVVDVRDGVVFLNATAADGMKPGLELLVFEQQPALVDPETGKSLGSPERQVGVIVVDTVQDRFSTARIASGEGIARGNVIRFKDTK